MKKILLLVVILVLIVVIFFVVQRKDSQDNQEGAATIETENIKQEEETYLLGGTLYEINDDVVTMKAFISRYEGDELVFIEEGSDIRVVIPSDIAIQRVILQIPSGLETIEIDSLESTTDQVNLTTMQSDLQESETVANRVAVGIEINATLVDGVFQANTVEYRYPNFLE